MPNTSTYPGTVDSISDVSTGGLITSALQNLQSHAILNIENSLGVNPTRLIVEGRLTLTTGTPVTTSDVDSATVYFTPFNGNRVALFDGAGTWNILSFTEKTVSVSSLNVNKNFDVFAYNNSGVVALEVLEWTNDTTRATALALQDGVYVKSGTTTRRYLGTGRTVSSSGTKARDALRQRFLFNAYNRVLRMMAVTDSTTTWNYTNATFQQANASAANQVELVIGTVSPEDVVSVQVQHLASNTNSSIAAAAGVGIDSTSTNSAEVYGGYLASAGDRYTLMARYRGTLSAGYHYIAWLEASAATGTTSFYGSASALHKSGMTAEILC